MKISVVMGTLNEERAIGKVIADIQKVTEGKAEIVVVDSSIDKTAEIAQKLGAKVIRQEPKGYGIAVRTALLAAMGDVIFTTDCDNTYPVEAIPEFLEWIEKGYDIVSGSRIHRRNKAMPLSNKLANWGFAALTRILYGIKTHDVATGMRAYRREVIHNIKWETNFALPAELVIRPVLAGYKFKELEIDYRERIGEITLHKFRSGKAFLRCIFKYKFNLKYDESLL